MLKRIDVHGHYFPPAYEKLLEKYGLAYLDGARKPVWTEDIQLDYMKRLNIAYTAISISSPHLHMGDAGEAIETARSCNEYGAEFSQKYKGWFAIMASLPLPEIEASIKEIQYCRKHLKTDGFALQTHFRGVYLGSPQLEPVMAELNRHKTVVSIHPTRPAAAPEGVNEKLPSALLEYFFDTTRALTNMLLNGTIRRYPNIRFLIPHAGAFLPIVSDRLDILGNALNLGYDLDVMGDLSRLYYDLAGISMPKQYDVLHRITDDSHIMYGSDEPFTPVALCTQLAEEMDNMLTEEMTKKIYLQNPLALFPNAVKVV